MVLTSYVIDSVDGSTKDGDAKPATFVLRVGRHDDAPKAPFPMCFTRQALRHLLDSVGALPPESGAKGFGPLDRIGIDRVEFDEQGSVAAGGAVYSPDAEWGRQRCDYHLSQAEPDTRVWTADLHSHPGGYGSPSSVAGKGLGDLGYVKEVFDENETMEWFFIPILTGTGCESQEITIHPWIVRRDGTVFLADLKICEPSEFPAREYNPEWLRKANSMPTEHSEDALLADAVPTQADQPQMTTTAAPAACTVVDPHGADTHDRMDEAKPDAVSSKKVEGGGTPSGTRLPAANVTVPVNNAQTAAGARQLVHELYIARLQGIVSKLFHTKTVGAVGAGAGSYMIEKLGRISPRCIKLCDFDDIELPNLVRTCYTYPDAVVRRKKVVAMARRLEEINPLVDVDCFAHSITAMDDDTLDEFFDGMDLVIAGTDHFPAQALINEEAVRRGIPAVFIGIHAGAQGGRVIWSVPGQTPCYRCVARDRFEAVEQNRSTADLAAALGAIVDCQFIDMIALKMVLAILERGQNSAMGRFFQRVGDRNDIIVRCDPAYGWGNAMWDAALADLPATPKAYAQELKDAALFAMDSLWLRGEFDPNCPVCGGGRRVAAVHATRL